MLEGGYEWQDITAPEYAGVVNRVMSEHTYLSTGCAHDRHEYCSADVVQGETSARTGFPSLARVKKPSQCKWCDSFCICRCHCVGVQATTDIRPNIEKGEWYCERHESPWPCEEGWSKYTNEEEAEIEKRGGEAPMGASFIQVESERAD